MTGITGYGDYKRVAGTDGRSTGRSAGWMPGDLPYLPILVPGYRACLNPSFPRMYDRRENIRRN